MSRVNPPDLRDTAPYYANWMIYIQSLHLPICVTNDAPSSCSIFDGCRPSLGIARMNDFHVYLTQPLKVPGNGQMASGVPDPALQQLAGVILDVIARASKR